MSRILSLLGLLTLALALAGCPTTAPDDDDTGSEDDDDALDDDDSGPDDDDSALDDDDSGPDDDDSGPDDDDSGSDDDDSGSDDDDLVDDDDSALDDDDSALDDDDSTPVDDDDVVVDDDDSAPVDDDDVVVDDDDSAPVDDDDSAPVDDDDSATVDDDDVADDDDSAATVESCVVEWSLDCGVADADSYNNGSFGSTDQVAEYSCSPGLSEDGPEYVYEVVVPVADSYTVELTGLSADLDLFVLDGSVGDCDPAQCLEYSAGVGTADESATFVAAAAGDVFYVAVDGFAGAVSDYTVTLSCPDSVCPESEDSFTCVVNSFSGDTATGDSLVDSWSGCSSFTSWTGPELIYEFTPMSTGEYSFDLTGLGSDVDLFVVEEESISGACDASGCLDYSNNVGTSDESVTIALETGVTYYVIVDGWSGSSSAFDLTLTCPECAIDYPLNCVASSDSWTNGLGATNTWEDYSCTSYSDNESGPEYVYVFAVDADGDATVDLTGLTSDLDLFVLSAAVDGGCDPNECFDSSRNSSTADESVTWSVLAGETWYVVVDGFQGNTSWWTITLSCL